VRPLHIIIISGLSGSGKSTAMRALEDNGFFCIDNMPATLIPTFAELCQHSTRELSRVAFAVDIRGQEFLENVRKILEGLKAQGHHVMILFLESSDEMLIRRYSETRRRHPLEKERGMSLPDAVRQERGEVAFLRDVADEVIDTTHLTVHGLRDVIIDRLLAPVPQKMKITVMSFGYSYGIPPEADIVMDVRFLPNPFFVPELRMLTGRDGLVKDYVLEKDETGDFLKRFGELIDYLIPHYEREGKSYLTIAVGCTGGKHRSVVIAESLADRARQMGMSVDVRHRDMERG